MLGFQKSHYTPEAHLENFELACSYCTLSCQNIFFIVWNCSWTLIICAIIVIRNWFVEIWLCSWLLWCIYLQLFVDLTCTNWELGLLNIGKIWILAFQNPRNKLTGLLEWNAWMVQIILESFLEQSIRVLGSDHIERLRDFCLDYVDFLQFIVLFSRVIFSALVVFLLFHWLSWCMYLLLGILYYLDRS